MPRHRVETVPDGKDLSSRLLAALIPTDNLPGAPNSHLGFELRHHRAKYTLLGAIKTFQDLVEETYMPTSVEAVAGGLAELETLEADYQKKKESSEQVITARYRYLQLDRVSQTWDKNIDFSYDAELAADMDAIRTLQSKVRQKLGSATRISLLGAVITTLREKNDAEDALAVHREHLEEIQKEKHKRATVKRCRTNHCGKKIYWC